MLTVATETIGLPREVKLKVTKRTGREGRRSRLRKVHRSCQKKFEAIDNSTARTDAMSNRMSVWVKNRKSKSVPLAGSMPESGESYSRNNVPWFTKYPIPPPMRNLMNVAETGNRWSMEEG